MGYAIMIMITSEFPYYSMSHDMTERLSHYDMHWQVQETSPRGAQLLHHYIGSAAFDHGV